MQYAIDCGVQSASGGLESGPSAVMAPGSPAHCRWHRPELHAHPLPGGTRSRSSDAFASEQPWQPEHAIAAATSQPHERAHHHPRMCTRSL